MSVSERRASYRESLRQEILDAARELFVVEGYDATSVRRIAVKAGCSAGILYHYFEDKAAIMAQLVRETFGRLNSRLTEVREDPAPPLDRLRRALRTYIDFGLDHPHHYGVLFTKPILPDSKIMEVFHTEGNQCFGCLQTLTGFTIASGALRPELTDAAEVAQALWVSIHGLVSAMTLAKGFPFVERSRLVERQVDILIAGVRR
ncbi:MAG: TetR/AcrR family transcriptional regulator [Bryobacteraceae bacterium]|nr:TetR/AcrR family transcriptional regulator [Bryobacteraceae bacterium]